MFSKIITLFIKISDIDTLQEICELFKASKRGKVLHDRIFLK